MKALTPKRAVLAVILAALVVAAVVPAIAYAVDGDYVNPVVLTVPSTVSGTLNLVPASGEDEAYGMYAYSVHLTKGQTLAATLSVDPSVTYPYLDACSDNVKITTDQYSDPVPGSYLQRLRLLAPATGTYYVVAYADNAGPYSIDAAIVPAVYYKLSSMTVPKAGTPRKNKAFTVSASVAPDYDGLTSPMTFYVQRYLNKKWRTYGAAHAGVLAPGGTVSKTPFKTSLKLPAGTFRVRARFMDAGHPSAKYTAWKTVKVK